MFTESIALQGKPANSIPQVNFSVQNNVFPEEKNTKNENEKPAGLAAVEDIISGLQNNIKSLHDVDLNFSVHEASGRIMITVMDEHTGEILREIPSSEMLDLAVKLEEAIGLLIDKKV